MVDLNILTFSDCNLPMTLFLHAFILFFLPFTLLPHIFYLPHLHMVVLLQLTCRQQVVLMPGHFLL